LQYRCSKSKQTIKALFVPTTGTHNLQGLQVHCQLSGQHCRIVLQATQKISLYKCQLELSFAFMPTDGLLCNGFQSWTNTKVFSTTDTQLAIHPLLTYIAAPMGDYALYDYPEKQGILHGWTYGIAQRSPQQQFLFGSINEQSGYTLVQFKVPNNTVLFKKDLKGKHLKPHKSFVALDVVMIQGSEQHIWQSYTQQFKANLPLTPTATLPKLPHKLAVLPLGTTTIPPSAKKLLPTICKTLCNKTYLSMCFRLTTVGKLLWAIGHNLTTSFRQVCTTWHSK
jgi:hypothetical protein